MSPVCLPTLSFVSRNPRTFKRLHYLTSDYMIRSQIQAYSTHWWYCSKLQPPRSSDTRVRGSDEAKSSAAGRERRTAIGRCREERGWNWGKKKKKALKKDSLIPKSWNSKVIQEHTKRLMITWGERREPERPAALNHYGHNPPYHWNKQLFFISQQKQHIMLGA